MKYTVTNTVNDEYIKLGLIAKVVFGGKDICFCKDFPTAELVCETMNAALTLGS